MNRRRLLAQLGAATTTALLPWPASAQEPAPAPVPPPPRAYVSFVVNVQDFRYPGTSAATMQRLCDIYRSHGVKGDLYLTHPVLSLYQQQGHDTVITALADQGLCYHVRPPHPLFHPFDAGLKSLPASVLRETLLRYESFALDLGTGELDKTRPGGFLGVSQLMGRPPVCVGLPNPDAAIRKAALDIYTSLGAQAVVSYHGERADKERPYKRVQGLLARPADIVIDRWKSGGEARGELWWNRVSEGSVSRDDLPENQLEARLSTWDGARPPFVLCVIHENNFTHYGPDAWLNIYWEDRAKTKARIPPFDLAAPDPSRLRSGREQERILEAYDRLVAWCASNCRVVTMQDIVEMAPPA